MQLFVRLFFFLFFLFSSLTACQQAPENNTHVVMQEGQFWADLIIMPEAELSEFEKPSNEKLEISMLSEVSVDERIALKVMFSAMARSKNSTADVTFDTEMIRPDGTLSEDASHTDLPARQGEMPAPLNVHNSDATLILSFDTEDQKGTYVINVVVRDNISGNKIPIRKEFQLVD